MVNFTEITDFHAPELDVYARLTEAQLLNRFEPQKGMFIAESPKVIQRALAAGCSSTMRTPCLHSSKMNMKRSIHLPISPPDAIPW